MKKTILFFLFSIVTTAQSLDTTFDTDGILAEQANAFGSSQAIYDEVVHNNKQFRVGSVVRYGHNNTYNNGGTKGVVAVYDTSGLFIMKEMGTYALQTICLQADEKIVVAGRNTIYRLLTDGNFDTTFNITGSQVVNLGANPMNIKCISTQTDGKIVVSGYISNGTNNDFAIARLNANGSFDTTFDSDGIQIIALGLSNDQAFSHKIQSDNKIVIAGESVGASTNYDFAVVRLNTNVTLDTTFNGTGKRTADFSNAADRGRSIEILPDGKIVLFGQAAGNFGIVKLNADGINLDTGFGNSGKTMLSESLGLSTAILSTTVHYISKIKVLSNGKMLLIGTSNNDVKFIKLQSNGQLDTTFGANGVCVVNNDIDTASCFNVNNLDEIYFTATTTTTPLYSYYSQSLSGTISSNGQIVNSLPESFFKENYFQDFEVLSDGSYLNLISLPYVDLLKLIKYLPNGTIDTAFGVNGSMSFSPDTMRSAFIEIFSDKIFVTIDTEIYKINSNGTLDLSFDNDGKINVYEIIAANYPNSYLNYIDDFKIDQFGNLFLSVDLEQYNPSFSISFGVLKFSNNGVLINSFGNNGLFTTRFDSDLNRMEFPASFLFQNDGKIVVLGFSYATGETTPIYKYLSLRLESNGIIDTTYGVNGKILTQFSTNNFDNQVMDVFMLNDNTVYLFTRVNGTFNNVKLLSNGFVDVAHGTNGVSNDVIGTTNYSMAIQSDGKILKAGYKANQFSISRYNADGSIDTAFGTNGEVNVVSLGINGTYLESIFDNIAIQPDGKIIAGGNSFDGEYQVSTLIRITNTTLGNLDFSSTENVLSIYPNPIETTATFEFSLANSENITIELYDVQGKLVQTIATNKQMASGKHNLPIELNSNLTSGNYFLKLSTLKGSQSIQIIKK